MITEENSAMIVNIPCSREDQTCTITSSIPDKGDLSLKAKKEGIYGFRKYSWMQDPVCTVNDMPADPDFRGENICFHLRPGDQLRMTFPLETLEIRETIRNTDYTVLYRGCDVVDLLPHGGHIRLYQRDESRPKYYPKPEDVCYKGASNYGPTQQKR